ncbi:MAG: hypothetical protein ACI965_000469 [Paraglaciecola sp.]|jgi:hypothetical protein
MFILGDENKIVLAKFANLTRALQRLMNVLNRAGSVKHRPQTRLQG